MRIAADYLGANPPFPIHHAERVIPETVQDGLLQLGLTTFDSLRRILELPWTILMAVLVVACILLEKVVSVLEMVTARRESVKGELSTLEMIGELRKMFESSRGGSMRGKRVKFA